MFKILLCFILAPALLIGCASLPDDKSVQNRAERASQSKTSSQTIMQRAKLKQSKAASESLALYGPTFLEKATKAYKKANILYKEKADTESIKLEASISIEYINAGLRNKKVVKDTLKTSLANHDILLQLNAPKIDPTGYDKILNKLLHTVRLIEQRKLDEAKEEEKNVNQYMHQFEIRIIGKRYLKECLSTLANADKHDAKTLLPETYNETLNSLNDTRQFIRQNPRQALKIEQLANQCVFQAQRLLALTKEANRFKNTTPQQMERYLLLQEERLVRIAKELGHDDIRNLSFDDQSRMLSNQAEASAHLLAVAESDNAKLSPAQFEKWKRKTVLLQSEVRRLKKMIKRLENQ
jgi:hypothetical protein